MSVVHNIQAMRGVAAMMVAVGHAAVYHLLVVTWPPDPFIVCYGGVDIFFVISGFIICSSAVKHEASSWRFFAKRCSRVFPLYWIVLAVSAFVALWGKIGGSFWSIPEYPIVDYILLSTKENRIIPQAWSLSFELYFYIWIALILLLGRRRFWLAMVGLMIGHAFMVGRALLGGVDPDTFVSTSWLVFEFGMGCGVAFVCSRGGGARFVGAAVALGVFFFAAGIEWTSRSGAPLTSLPRTITLGLGSAALLYAAVGAETKGIVLPRWVQRLGDASYSIYLWHLLVFELATRVVPVETFMTVPTRNAYGATVFAILIGLSFASYRLIEVRATRIAGSLLAVRDFGSDTSATCALRGF
jgi:exopolysaccharide production protein ExoZ